MIQPNPHSHLLEGLEGHVYHTVFKPNTTIELAGDSLWRSTAPGGDNPTTVTLYEATLSIDVEAPDASDVIVLHAGPWQVYSDSAFATQVSELLEFDVVFTEQGMQIDCNASLELADYDRSVVNMVAAIKNMTRVE